jgi:hypothetical protein
LLLNARSAMPRTAAQHPSARKQACWQARLRVRTQLLDDTPTAHTGVRTLLVAVNRVSPLLGQLLDHADDVIVPQRLAALPQFDLPLLQGRVKESNGVKPADHEGDGDSSGTHNAYALLHAAVCACLGWALESNEQASSWGGDWLGKASGGLPRSPRAGHALHCHTWQCLWLSWLPSCHP